ncbi:preprotein translocase subunit YajC [Cephaloticoccus primus]|nr:preprotein translocase subunit YajC [Cephaloticoccus primus]
MPLLFDAFNFLAQAAPAPTGGLLGGMLPIVLLFAAMYFLMIAPQRKKQKAHDAMLKSLASGDEVVTTGGIYGQITNVKDDRFVLRIADNVKVEVGKSFISALARKAGE